MSDNLQPKSKNDKLTFTFMNKKIGVRYSIIWIVACALVVVILNYPWSKKNNPQSSKLSSPAGMDVTFYTSALDAFHTLDSDFYSKKMPDNSLVNWVYNESKLEEQNPNSLTTVEKSFIDLMRKAVTDMGVAYSTNMKNYTNADSYISQFEQEYRNIRPILFKDLGNIQNSYSNTQSLGTSTLQVPTTQSSDSQIPTSRTSSQVSYNSYINTRFGYQIKYPNNFTKGQEPTDGDGLIFTSNDKMAWIDVSGINNVSHETVKSAYNLELADHSRDIVKYSECGDNWFVVSWLSNGMIHYKKEYIGNGGEAVFAFSYPESQADYYNSIVTYVNNSFSPGDLSQPH